MTTLESTAAPMAITPGSLQEKAQALARDRNWECLTLVFGGMGTFGALQWRCKQDHRFSRSLHNAQLMFDCPECLRLQTLANRTEAAKRKKRQVAQLELRSTAHLAAPTPIVPKQKEERLPPSSSRPKGKVKRKKPVVQSRILG